MDWGDKGSTEAGARLAKAKVSNCFSVFCIFISFPKTSNRKIAELYGLCKVGVQLAS